jgi:DAK2 domain fusion protein YloV
VINSFKFKDAIISGANNIFKNRVHINELNIFPVPDGDTGTNMSMTIVGAADKIKNLDCLNTTVGEVAKMVAYASLRSARGNSGVILSLILKGFSQYLGNLDVASGEDLVKALEAGVKNAYSAVSKPTEGTMLTVARIAFERGHEALLEFNTEKSLKNTEDLSEFEKKYEIETNTKNCDVIEDARRLITKKGKDIIDGLRETLFEKTEKFKSTVLKNERNVLNKNEPVGISFSSNSGKKKDKNLDISDEICAKIWGSICAGAREALAQTPDLLPVLKKAGVVDAGGKGLCLIFEGMLSVFKENIIIDQEAQVISLEEDETLRAVSESFNEDINFTYCTEFIISKQIGVSFFLDKFRNNLEKIGDCVVVVDDEEIIKVHVHTNLPDKAIGAGLKVGQLVTVKIENMEEQRKIALEAASVEESKEIIEPKQRFKFETPNEEFGLVAVVFGDGLVSAFKELGCSAIVIGGQTMNPSSEEIAGAVCSVPAKNVYVLPNNKNIIMAAEQAKKLIEDRNLIVVPSKNIPQGMAAALAFERDKSLEENTSAMFSSMEKIRTGSITYAARDAEFNSFKIKKDDVLAFDGGKLIFLDNDPVKAAEKLLRKIAKNEMSFITLIYGKEITEEKAEELKNLISSFFSSSEITLINGGGSAYYFIVSIE